MKKMIIFSHLFSGHVFHVTLLMEKSKFWENWLKETSDATFIENFTVMMKKETSYVIKIVKKWRKEISGVI